MTLPMIPRMTLRFHKPAGMWSSAACSTASLWSGPRLSVNSFGTKMTTIARMRAVKGAADRGKQRRHLHAFAHSGHGAVEQHVPEALRIDGREREHRIDRHG